MAVSLLRSGTERPVMQKLAFLSSLTVLACGFVSAAEDKAPKHQDPYVAGLASESQIVKEVLHQLVILPYFGVFDDIGFSINGGTVTLTGQVTRPTLKSDAENVLKHLEGVTSVINNIEVLPLSPDDDRIRRAAYRAIFGDPSLNTRYGYQAISSIHIIVKNGNVRLEGLVANEGDKNLAGLRANSVSGAFSVENDLRIEGR
jgi:hyperosmotically inducible protein